MTRTNELKSVNCTSCGAGLDILGGGRVQVHACGYCGSVLDAQENYKVIKQYADLKRPESPFSIGMSGIIQGVEFTIIGTLGFQESWGGRRWTWTDHQLFSPTHGYAYLTVERGHLTFTRAYRKGTRPNWITSKTVEIAESRPSASSNGDRYQYYDTSTSQLTFVEGEFNWHPEIGRATMSVNMMSEDAMLAFTETTTEREVHRTIYLPFTPTCTSFGIADALAPSDVHKLMPYKAGQNEGFLRNASLIFLAVSLVLTMFLLGQSKGSHVFLERLSANDLPAELSIEISRPDQLARMSLSADVNNSWAYLDVALSDPNGDPVFEAGRTVELYRGTSSDGAWREGNKQTTISFRPKLAGAYTLEIGSSESGRWGNTSGRAFGAVTVRVTDGAATTRWMLGLMLVFAGISAYQIARPMLHSRRRWWGSDWVDEDDD
ncbi:DUF4178 domain-containing protein [Halocynthiibacter namhaensis]|uniref:DUF4178 domain-containing protein n=1 Tax=Halocynthiibacter namhaensis TaxID=1290553 RepID=UPI000578E3C3|nr:DUF4178 domain-containing protein [Halocynthiibacter namhaensis]